MAKQSCLITCGTTPFNLVQALRGTSYSGVSLSHAFGANLPDQCRELIISCDNGTIYVGDDSTVSSSNYGARLLAGSSKRNADATLSNSINLGDNWIIAAASGAKVAVEWHTA